MNFDLAAYSSDLYTNTFMIDRAIKVLTEAEKSLVTVINLFSELSQTIGTVDSNTVKKKIVSYLDTHKIENRTVFNTFWSWNIIPRNQSVGSNNTCRISWAYFISIVDNGDGTYGAISYGNTKNVNNSSGTVPENTNIANLLIDISSETNRLNTIIRTVRYRKCAILNILSINNNYLN